MKDEIERFLPLIVKAKFFVIGYAAIELLSALGNSVGEAGSASGANRIE